MLKIKKELSVIIMSIFAFSIPVFSQTIKIMPLGDSILRGSTGSWKGDTSVPTNQIRIGSRGPLFDALKKLHVLFPSVYPDFDFVGSLSDGTPTNRPPDPITPAYYDTLNYYDRDHEGHSGFTAKGVANQVQTWLTTSPADIALLHIGTNDIDAGTNDTIQIKDSVKAILNNIDTYEGSHPPVVVVLAKIINRADILDNPPSVKSKRTTGLNRELDTLATERILNNDKIILVDMEKDAGFNYAIDNTFPFNSGDLFDLLHPNQTGYNKMFGVWSKAVISYFNGTPILAGPTNNAALRKTPITLTWGITQNSSSYLVQVSKDQNFSADSLIYNTTTSNRYAVINSSIPAGILSSKKYYWRVNQTLYSNVWNFTTPPLTLAAKIYLQGPYAGSGTMNTTLNSSGFIPASQPYNTAPWNYNGTESVASVPSGVVDWVLLELRSGTSSSTISGRRAAFLKSDGTIVDTDGISPVKFNLVPFGNYYVVIRHRNHLAVMSSAAVSLANTSLTYDFTTGSGQFFGTGGAVEVGTGVWGMIAGDANKSSIVSFSDITPIITNNNNNGYSPEDINLSGITSFADITSIINNNNKNSQVP